MSITGAAMRYRSLLSGGTELIEDIRVVRILTSQTMTRCSGLAAALIDQPIDVAGARGGTWVV